MEAVIWWNSSIKPFRMEKERRMIELINDADRKRKLQEIRNCGEMKTLVRYMECL